MKTATTSKILAFFWRYTSRNLTHFLVGGVGAAIAVTAQNMIPPLVVSRLFSKLQTSYALHQKLSFSSVLPYFIIYAISMLLGAVMWRVQSFAVWKLEINVRRDMSNDMYDHLQAQSQRFHADRFGGALVSQATKILGGYERLTDDFIWTIIPGVTTIVVAIVVLLFISYVYAVILLFVILAYLVIMSIRISHQMAYNIAEAKTESNQTAALADAITNISTIRANAQEDYESKRFRAVTDKTYKAYSKLSIEVFKTEALSHIQTNSFQIMALFAGLVAVTTYGANVSLLYLVLSYTQNIVNNLWQFGRTVRNVNRSLGDSAEMTEIMQIEPEIQDPKQPETPRISRGEVIFDNVHFAYEEDNKALFNNFTMKIKPGEKVGLVGSSGGGKTTISKLLLRFMDVQHGKITIDGQNIANITQAQLRSRIAYVPQEPLLFHRTIQENISYTNPDASEPEIFAVSKLANAHEFVLGLPHGYQTLVGERGVKLSGGQRQRIAIARAMLKNAPILVLDEATSALDSKSEVLIQDALWKLMEGRTAIVIAHRLSTIQKMDRIIVLENGVIVEQGSHKELLRKDGVYAQLWAHQSGGFIDK
jgi:ATP-binding cassette, subfamily B, bacterial